jgi:hypothetical protein
MLCRGLIVCMGLPLSPLADQFYLYGCVMLTRYGGNVFHESFTCSWLDAIKICRLSAIIANKTFIIASLPVRFKAIFMVLLQF